MSKFVRLPHEILGLLPTINPNSLKIYIYLLSKSYYTGNQYSFVIASKNDITDGTGISRPTVNKSVGDLVSIGVIAKNGDTYQFTDPDVKKFYTSDVKKIDKNVKKLYIDVKKLYIPCKKTLHEAPLKASSTEAIRAPIEQDRINIEIEQEGIVDFLDNPGIRRILNYHTDKELLSMREKYSSDNTPPVAIQKNKTLIKYLKLYHKLAPPGDHSEGAESLRQYIDDALLDSMVAGKDPTPRFIVILRKLMVDGERIELPNMERVKKIESYDELIKMENEDKVNKTEKVIAQSIENEKIAIESEKLESDFLDYYRDQYAHLIPLAEGIASEKAGVLSKKGNPIWDRMYKIALKHMIAEEVEKNKIIR